MTDSIDFPQADKATGCLHPRETYNLIGHNQAELVFLRAIRSDKLHHAWLLTGQKGVGKATLAYRMIRTILGGQSRLETSIDVTEQDPVAQRIQSLGHGDFFLLRRPYDHKSKKLRSEIPVAETRKLQDFFSHKASEGGWRVCLVDSMDEMNRNAENGILKILEEPPEKSIIILLSSAPGRLLPTIRSRCQILSLRPVSLEDIASWLRSLDKWDDELIGSASQLSRGAPGKALALMQNADDVLKPLQLFLKSLEKGDARVDQKLANTLSGNGFSLQRQLFWDALEDILHAQAIYSLTGEWQGAFGPMSASKTPSTWQRLWQQVGHFKSRESAINMDKKTVMQDVLSGIRTA